MKQEHVPVFLRWYLDNQELMENVTSGDYLKYYTEMYSNR